MYTLIVYGEKYALGHYLQENLSAVIWDLATLCKNPASNFLAWGGKILNFPLLARYF